MPLNFDGVGNKTFVQSIFGKAKVMLVSVLRPRAGRFSAPFNTKQTMSFLYNQYLNPKIFRTYFF
jgi:hypothetical protein